MWHGAKTEEELIAEGETRRRERAERDAAIVRRRRRRYAMIAGALALVCLLTAGWPVVDLAWWWRLLYVALYQGLLLALYRLHANPLWGMIGSAVIFGLFYAGLPALGAFRTVVIYAILWAIFMAPLGGAFAMMLNLTDEE